MVMFENVTKIYEPDVAALQDVSFVIDKGEFVFIVGASGSGKSTVIRLVLKELEPTRGRIVVGGRDLGRLKRSKVPLLRRNVGCVFQDFKLLPNRTAAENVAYALKVQGENSTAIRRKVPEVLNLVGLDAQDVVAARRALRRRAAARLDRARVRQPPAAADLRRADRATSTPTRASGSCSCSTGSTAPGTTILMVTHDREMVDKMRKRVIALEDGKLAARRAARRVHLRMSRFRVIVSEAIRSLGANLSTTFAATMTVLIGMFMLGLVVGARQLGALAERPLQEAAARERLLLHPARAAEARRSTGQIDDVRHAADRDAAGEERPLRLQGRGARDRAQEAPRAGRQACPTTRCRTRSRSSPKRAEDIDAIATQLGTSKPKGVETICPPAPGSKAAATGIGESCSRSRTACSRWRAISGSSS